MEITLNRRDQITKRATKLFRERGYAATSMRDLASAVGIEPASIYSHIKSKEEILRQICFEMADLFLSESELVLAAQTSPKEKLKQAIHAHVLVVTYNLEASAVFLQEWRHLSEPFLSEFIQIRKSYQNYIMQLLKAAVDATEIEVEDYRITTLSLLSALNWVFEWYKPDGRLGAVEIADLIYNLFLNGLTKKQ